MPDKLTDEVIPEEPTKYDAEQAQRERIEALKQQANELAGGEMTHYEADDIDPNIAEAFWENVLAFESAEPGETLFVELEKAGVKLPAPDDLDDVQVTEKVWEVAHKLGEWNVFLEHTDHLSDRELYAHLWTDSLREPPMMPVGMPGWNCNISMIGSYGEEELEIMHRYYESPEDRREWLERYPDQTLPEPETLPYNRDMYLPKPNYGLDEEEPEEPPVM
jgi:hypothetical protein